MQISCPAGWEDVNVRFLCGADLLESFSVPNLWKEEDVCVHKFDKCLILSLE